MLRHSFAGTSCRCPNHTSDLLFLVLLKLEFQFLVTGFLDHIDGLVILRLILCLDGDRCILLDAAKRVLADLL